MPEVIEEMEKFFSERKPDIVLVDFAAVPVGIACEKSGLPWITSIPTPFAIESRTTPPAYAGGLYPKDGFFFKLRDKLARSFIRNYKRLLCFILRKQIKELNFTLYNEKGEENIYSPYSILALGMKEFEFRDDFPEQFIWAGSCCSSHLKWAKNIMIDVAKELSKLYPKFLFVVSLGSYPERDKEVLKENNLHIYHYLDYDEVIPKIDYAVHHGGTGILYSCIKYNKPAVVIPHDYDQFDYAVRADLAEIGIVAKLKSRKNILKAFEKMLQRKEWNNLEKMSKDFNKYLPSEVLKKEIDRLLKGGK